MKMHADVRSYLAHAAELSGSAVDLDDNHLDLVVSYLLGAVTILSAIPEGKASIERVSKRIAPKKAVASGG